MGGGHHHRKRAIKPAKGHCRGKNKGVKGIFTQEMLFFIAE